MQAAQGGDPNFGNWWSNNVAAGQTSRQGGGGGSFGPQVQAGQSSDWANSLLGARANWGANNTGAALAPPPRIDAGPIWNSQQIQGRVNQMRASNDQATATRTQNMNAGMQAKGFGSDSPLSQALSAQYAGQNLGANTGGENDIRWNAAQGNADHLLQAQMGRSSQWNQQNEQAIANKRLQLQNQSSLMSVLSGLY